MLSDPCCWHDALSLSRRSSVNLAWTAMAEHRLCMASNFLRHGAILAAPYTTSNLENGNHLKKLKRSLILLATVAVFQVGITSPAFAQPPSDEQITATENAIRPDGKYALSVSNAQHLEAAIMTGREFKAKSSAIDFQIVAYGQVVSEIATDQAVKDAARRAVNDDGLKIVVCDIAVKALGVDPACCRPKYRPLRTL